MKLITYDYMEVRYSGIVANNGEIFSFQDLGIPYRTLASLIRQGDMHIIEEMKVKVAQRSLEPSLKRVFLEDVKLWAPIEAPAQDVICLGLNYEEHKEEGSKYSKEAFGGEDSAPIYFSKRVNRFIGPNEPIDGHWDLVEKLDYEVELGVIIGKEARNVSLENALDYVFGYTIINDISARNLQTKHKQWYFGKSLDAFTPMGPVVVTSDEAGSPKDWGIRCFVNGELRQDGNTKDMIYDVSYIIHQLSQGITLVPGTVIATGTPAGVGMGFQPPKFLSAGDTLVCEIDGIGVLENGVI